jgi:uncharacterized UPF0160 family protein
LEFLGNKSLMDFSEIIPRSVGIHDGSFHADEVTACGLLMLFDLVDKDRIFRTRDEGVLNRCEYLCDVGGVWDPKKKRFDHHQANYTGDFSSAGMVLQYLFDEHILDSSLYYHLKRGLVQGIDEHDTGKSRLEEGVCTFSMVISNFLPIHYGAAKEEMEKAFFEALSFTFGHLQRLRQRHLYQQECRQIVKEHMEKQRLCLIFDEPIAWIESFFELQGEAHPALFVIMPTDNNVWKLRGIPPSYKNRMQVRCALPREWAGLQGEELQKVSHLEGAVFCHKGRFISIWKTKEDALKALEYVLKKAGIK